MTLFQFEWVEDSDDDYAECDWNGLSLEVDYRKSDDVYRAGWECRVWKDGHIILNLISEGIEPLTKAGAKRLAEMTVVYLYYVQDEYVWRHTPAGDAVIAEEEEEKEEQADESEPAESDLSDFEADILRMVPGAESKRFVTSSYLFVRLDFPGRGPGDPAGALRNAFLRLMKYGLIRVSSRGSFDEQSWQRTPAGDAVVAKEELKGRTVEEGSPVSSEQKTKPVDEGVHPVYRPGNVLPNDMPKEDAGDEGGGLVWHIDQLMLAVAKAGCSAAEKADMSEAMKAIHGLATLAAVRREVA